MQPDREHRGQTLVMNQRTQQCTIKRPCCMTRDRPSQPRTTLLHARPAQPTSGPRIVAAHRYRLSSDTGLAEHPSGGWGGCKSRSSKLATSASCGAAWAAGQGHRRQGKRTSDLMDRRSESSLSCAACWCAIFHTNLALQRLLAGEKANSDDRGHYGATELRLQTAEALGWSAGSL